MQNPFFKFTHSKAALLVICRMPVLVRGKFEMSKRVNWAFALSVTVTTPDNCEPESAEF